MPALRPTRRGGRQALRHRQRRPLPAALLPICLLLAALALAAATLAAEAGRRADRAELVERIAGLDLPRHRRARLAEWAARQDDPTETRMEVGRLLVNETVNPPEGDDGDDGEGNSDTAPGDPRTLPLTQPITQPLTQPLTLARDLASEAMTRRPAAWRAPAVLASAIYLERSEAGDPRLITEASDWDRPLDRARALAPTVDEPPRFQAVAYLELWPTLSAEKQAAARDLLRLALRDSPTFNRVIPAWLTISEAADDSLEETLEVVPNQPLAWSTLEGLFVRQRNWQGAVEARRRWRDAMVAALRDRLTEASQMVSQRRGYDARLAYLKVIADAPREAAFVPLVAEALAEAPPGAALPALTEPLGRWLDWALALDLVGANPFPETLDRLAGLVSDLPPAKAAHAAVAAGDLAKGERLEEAAPLGDPSRDPWGGYRIAKAAHLGERCDEALASLAQLPPPWRQRPSARAALTACEASGTGAADSTARVEWQGVSTSSAEKSDPRLEAGIPWPARGLRVEGESGNDALVEVRLDGRVLAIQRVRPGRSTEVETEITPGLHLLEVATLHGDFRPLAVTWLAAQGSGSGRRAAEGD